MGGAVILERERERTSEERPRGGGRSRRPLEGNSEGGREERARGGDQTGFLIKIAKVREGGDDELGDGLGTRGSRFQSRNNFSSP